jgi:predicted ATPase
MKTSATRLIVLSGGPGAGKTSVIEMLGAEGHATASEAGRAVIREQRAIDGPALPDRDPLLFADRMLDHDVRAHAAATARGGVTFFDRGVVDNAGYLRLCGLPLPERFARACRRLRYDHVYLAPPWPEIYTHDGERRQDFAEAQRTFEAVRDAWIVFGYRPEILPRTTVADRVAFILSRL